MKKPFGIIVLFLSQNVGKSFAQSASEHRGTVAIVAGGFEKLSDLEAFETVERIKEKTAASDARTITSEQDLTAAKELPENLKESREELYERQEREHRRALWIEQRKREKSLEAARRRQFKR